MPRLPQEVVDAINRGEVPESVKRGPAPEGFYLCKPVQADEADEKESGYAGTDVRWEVIRPVEYARKKFFDYMSYGPSSAWKWRDMFAAAGYAVDSDLDELIDDSAEVILEIEQEIQTQGRKKGQVRNNVVGFVKPDDDGLALLIED